MMPMKVFTLTSIMALILLLPGCHCPSNSNFSSIESRLSSIERRLDRISDQLAQSKQNESVSYIAVLIRKLDNFGSTTGGPIAELTKVGKPAVPHLIKALNHKSWFVQRGAAAALGKIGDFSATRSLLRIVIDNKCAASVVYASILALGEIGDKNAIKPLIDTMPNKDKHYLWHYAKALNRLTGANLGPEYDAWRSWLANEIKKDD